MFPLRDVVVIKSLLVSGKLCCSMPNFGVINLVFILHLLQIFDFHAFTLVLLFNVCCRQ